MTATKDRIATLMQEGQSAARIARKSKARHKFRTALVLDPTHVPAMLWMAWLSEDPRVSLAYVARALTYAPHDPRAHAALRWARRRATTSVSQKPPASAIPEPEPHPWWRRPAAALVLGLSIILISGALTWVVSQSLPVSAARDRTPSPLLPTATAARPACTESATSTPTHSPSPTAIPAPTSTPTLSPTVSPSPSSNLPTAPPLPQTATLAPSSIRSNIRWIDVDLTHQRLSAYEGQELVRTTLVSTGLPRTPTPAGRYHIWLKLRYDDMSGPGYYLPNVPYVMYFYGGYGLHGTYWHSNFGHPMSHGCVNLPTDVAEWLFNWAKVGTLVNIHN